MLAANLTKVTENKTRTYGSLASGGYIAILGAKFPFWDFKRKAVYEFFQIRRGLYEVKETRGVALMG